jgi:hypothetical protein
MKAITFADCFTGAWRDALKLMRQQPLFVAAISMAIFLLQFVFDKLEHAPKNHSLLLLLILIAVPLLKVGLMSAMAVKAMRYVLLDDVNTATSVGRAFWRYCGFTIVLVLGTVVGVMVAVKIVAFILPLGGIHAHARAIYMTSPVAFGMLAIWLNLRLCLLACHVAIGRALDLRAAWRDSRGNVWQIVGVHLALMLSLCVAVMPIGLLSSFVTFLLGEGSKESVLGLFEALASAPMMLVLGAGSAWVYRRFAKALLPALPPAVPPSAPSF